MEELAELKKQLPRDAGGFLTEIIQMNQWRDQKGDAAYAMICLSTIQLLIEKRPQTHHATALYLMASNYLLEPFVNPNMTNPMAITACVYIGYATLFRLLLSLLVHTVLPAHTNLTLSTY